MKPNICWLWVLSDHKLNRSNHNRPLTVCCLFFPTESGGYTDSIQDEHTATHAVNFNKRNGAINNIFLLLTGWLHAHLSGNVLVCGRVWAASRCTTALWPQRFSSSAGWAACWSARSQNSACPWISAQKWQMTAFVKDKKQYRHLQNKRSSEK